MNSDLKVIKKKYGEDMAKLCRELFPTLLETEGLLSKLLLDNFEVNHDLCQDILTQNLEEEFKRYIYSLVNVEKENIVDTKKTPQELLSEAGYELYECHSEEDIQKFKKYYAEGEELCTFRGGRLNKCIVFFAVKKDVDKIKREDYKVPRRQDDYGTSVISIQFTRDISHTLSIKNRYNHRVNNPDSTFSNNLDNIIKGLTESFEREYGLSQQHLNGCFEMNNYVLANDGKFYKYNFERGNIYFCPNNIVINNFNVRKYEKEKYIVFDNFILDLVNREIKRADGAKKDAFINTLGEIEKIEIEKQGKEKTIKLKIKNQEDVIIVLNANNQMIKLVNNNVKVIGNDFLTDNFLQEISLPNLEEVGYDFCMGNNSLQTITFPKLRRVEGNFLRYNNSLQEVNLPELEETSFYFLSENRSIKKLNCPKLKVIEDGSFRALTSLLELDCPNLEEVGSGVFRYNKLQSINCPKLRKVGNHFLEYTSSLQDINFPELEEIGDNFLVGFTKAIRSIKCPKLRKIGNHSLTYVNSLLKLSLPSLEEVGDDFLCDNEGLKKVDFPKLKKAGNRFLARNQVIEEVNIPNLEKVGREFLREHAIFNENNVRGNMRGLK